MTTTTSATFLDVKNLRVAYYTRRGVTHAVDGVSFSLQQGHHLGIIGESGCGKSTMARALIRVMPRNARIVSGEVNFQGQDLVKLSEDRMRQKRWRDIAMIPQASMGSLDPVYRVGDQMAEVLIGQGGYNKARARQRSEELFGLVGLDPARLDSYPHEFSGGMKQRAVIAMSLALDPALIIADEPVTALDVIVQAQVLETFRELQARLRLSVIMITHDISVVAQTCDSVAVMYAGKIVERGSVRHIFNSPFHPYTLGLENAYPNLAKPKKALISIDGFPPDLARPPQGCRFAPRCPFALDHCFQEEPPLVEVEPGHLAACHRSHEVDILRSQAKEIETWQRVPTP